jgi:FkbM family methyltransferase
VACEPQPEAAQILRRGLAATGVGNTRVCTSAVGHVAGSGVLSVPVRRGRPVHGRAHLVNGFHGPDPNDEFRDGRSVAVDVVTLDQLVDRESLTSVDYVKADVEGAEAQVLHGGRRTIAAHRPIIQLEIESRFTRRFATTPAELVRDVQAMGYRMTGWDGSGWAPLDGVSPSRRNYVFLPVD